MSPSLNKLLWLACAQLASVLALPSTLQPVDESADVASASVADVASASVTAKMLPEASMTMEEIVKHYGYDVERHWATTKDGYILGMYRIPRGIKESKTATGKPVVFLQHALLDSSWAYVCNPPANSLAYLLADKGYDVWMGNNRGNVHSTNHTKGRAYVEGRQFWRFSWQEMALQDLPTQLNYALRVSGQKSLSYVGHSQGTLQAFTGFSANQDLAKKIDKFFAFAPVAFMEHQFGLASSTMRLLGGTIETFGSTTGGLGWFLSRFNAAILNTKKGIKRFDPKVLLDPLLKQADELCDIKVGTTKVGGSMCGGLISVIVGPSKNLDPDRMSVYISQTPAGTSLMNMVHFFEMTAGCPESTQEKPAANTDSCEHQNIDYFDYGDGFLTSFANNDDKRGWTNKKVYGCKEKGRFWGCKKANPVPHFDLSKNTVPTVLFVGANDAFSPPADMPKLKASLVSPHGADLKSSCTLHTPRV